MPGGWETLRVRGTKGATAQLHMLNLRRAYAYLTLMVAAVLFAGAAGIWASAAPAVTVQAVAVTGASAGQTYVDWTGDGVIDGLIDGTHPAGETVAVGLDAAGKPLGDTTDSALLWILILVMGIGTCVFLVFLALEDVPWYAAQRAARRDTRLLGRPRFSWFPYRAHAASSLRTNRLRLALLCFSPVTLVAELAACNPRTPIWALRLAAHRRRALWPALIAAPRLPATALEGICRESHNPRLLDAAAGHPHATASIWEAGFERGWITPGTIRHVAGRADCPAHILDRIARTSTDPAALRAVAGNPAAEETTAVEAFLRGGV